MDTRKEKVKEVKEEKEDGPIQQFVRKVSGNKFFVAVKGAINKVKNSRAKSKGKKEETKKAKGKSSNKQEKSS